MEIDLNDIIFHCQFSNPCQFHKSLNVLAVYVEVNFIATETGLEFVRIEPNGEGFVCFKVEKDCCSDWLTKFPQHKFNEEENEYDKMEDITNMFQDINGEYCISLAFNVQQLNLKLASATSSQLLDVYYLKSRPEILTFMLTARTKDTTRNFEVVLLDNNIGIERIEIPVMEFHHVLPIGSRPLFDYFRNASTACGNISVRLRPTHIDLTVADHHCTDTFSIRSYHQSSNMSDSNNKKKGEDLPIVLPSDISKEEKEEISNNFQSTYNVMPTEENVKPNVNEPMTFKWCENQFNVKLLQSYSKAHQLNKVVLVAMDDSFLTLRYDIEDIGYMLFVLCTTNDQDEQDAMIVEKEHHLQQTLEQERESKIVPLVQQTPQQQQALTQRPKQSYYAKNERPVKNPYTKVPITKEVHKNKKRKQPESIKEGEEQKNEDGDEDNDITKTQQKKQQKKNGNKRKKHLANLLKQKVQRSKIFGSPTTTTTTIPTNDSGNTDVNVIIHQENNHNDDFVDQIPVVDSVKKNVKKNKKSLMKEHEEEDQQNQAYNDYCIDPQELNNEKDIDMMKIKVHGELNKTRGMKQNKLSAWLALAQNKPLLQNPE